MLSAFQEKKLTYFFGLLDANKNGYLQLEDFQDIAENLCLNFDYEEGGRMHKIVVDRSIKLFYKLLKDITHSGDQVISTQEWLAFFDKHIIEKLDEEILDEYTEIIIGFLFDMFDQNHDGYISVDEYTDLFLIYGIDIKYSARAFVNLDHNYDDRLSRYELESAVQTFLTSDDDSQKGNWIFGNWNMIKDG